MEDAAVGILAGTLTVYTYSQMGIAYGFVTLYIDFKASQAQKRKCRSTWC
jgi:hypothetical protein